MKKLKKEIRWFSIMEKFAGLVLWSIPVIH